MRPTISIEVLEEGECSFVTTSQMKRRTNFRHQPDVEQLLGSIAIELVDRLEGNLKVYHELFIGNQIYHASPFFPGESMV
jgi:hypothetical protein